MATVLGFAAVAALVKSVVGSAIGAMPSQTAPAGGFVKGMGEPLSPAPTDAPDFELVRRRFEQKRAASINYCTEWTINGGYGEPGCYSPETCLFTSVGGYYYEGCGKTSVAYDWVTECWDYPQSGIAPISEIYCSAAAPYCGYYAFILASDVTYYNYGCSTLSYGLVVDLVDVATGSSSGTVILSGGRNSSITDTAIPTVYVTGTAGITTPQLNTQTVTINPGATPTATQGGSSASTSSSTQLGSHTTKKSTPVGAIAGGVVGGVTIIALIVFLIFFLRKKIKQKADAQALARLHQSQGHPPTQTAYQENNQPVAEATATNRKSYMGAFARVPEHEKQNGIIANTQEFYRPTQEQQDFHPMSQAPPPVYAQPSQVPSPNTPQTQYNDIPRPISTGPVSPVGSPRPQSHEIYNQPAPAPVPVPTPQPQGYIHPAHLAQLQAQAAQAQRQSMSASPAPVQELYTQPHQAPSELGGASRSTSPRPPQGPPPGFVAPQEMSAQGTGEQVQDSNASEMATSRQPRPLPRGFDMSGNSMGEGFNGAELE